VDCLIETGAVKLHEHAHCHVEVIVIALQGDSTQSSSVRVSHCCSVSPSSSFTSAAATLNGRVCYFCGCSGSSPQWWTLLAHLSYVNEVEGKNLVDHEEPSVLITDEKQILSAGARICLLLNAMFVRDLF